METKEMREGAECEKCGHCFMHGHGRRHWGHILVKVLVAVFIFWCGVQFGELKSVLHGGYGYGYNGYGMMGSYTTGKGQNYYYGPGGMMGWVSQQ